MKAEISERHVPLKQPFRYYLGELYSLPYAHVRITDGDFEGEGEIPCANDVNGELSESAPNLAPLINRILEGSTAESEEDIADAMGRIGANLAFNTAAKLGVEQALFSILSQKKGVSLAKLFGAEKKSVKSQCAISYLDTLDAYSKRIEDALSRNPEYIKFKVGRNLPLEASAIRKAREMNEKVGINIDANQAFSTPREAGDFLESIADSGLSWAEQPLRKESMGEWLELKALTDIPLMADESIHTPKDALFLLQNGYVDMINVKLAKCGGVLEARKIISVSRKFNAPAMLGSMIEGRLGLKYNLSFALSQDFVTHGFYSFSADVSEFIGDDLWSKEEVFC